MAYVDEGAGHPVLLLPGNPTSSYLWRHVIPALAPTRRTIALGLIGMGTSAKPDIPYRFTDHAAYLDGFIAALGLSHLGLVGHDRGWVLAQRHARNHEAGVRGLVLMVTHLPPAMPAPGYAAMGAGGEIFRRLRTPGEGERMVLMDNLFIEMVLPQFGTMRAMGEVEMAAYRAPFPTPESRRPILAWARQVPKGGEPADVAEVMTRNAAWLARTPLPKLLLHAEPGALVTADVVDHLTATVPGLATHLLGQGTQFLPEDHGRAIGQRNAAWLETL